MCTADAHVLLWSDTCPHYLQRRYHGQQSGSQHLPQFRSWQAQQQQPPLLPPQAPKQAVSQAQRHASAGTAAEASTQGEPAHPAAHQLLLKGVLAQVLVHQQWYLGRAACPRAAHAADNYLHWGVCIAQSVSKAFWEPAGQRCPPCCTFWCLLTGLLRLQPIWGGSQCTLCLLSLLYACCSVRSGTITKAGPAHHPGKTCCCPVQCSMLCRCCSVRSTASRACSVLHPAQICCCSLPASVKERNVGFAATRKVQGQVKNIPGSCSCRCRNSSASRRVWQHCTKIWLQCKPQL